MSCVCLVYVLCMSCLSLVYVLCISCLCLVYVLCMSCVRCEILSGTILLFTIQLLCIPPQWTSFCVSTSEFLWVTQKSFCETWTRVCVRNTVRYNTWGVLWGNVPCHAWQQRLTIRGPRLTGGFGHGLLSPLRAQQPAASRLEINCRDGFVDSQIETWFA